VAFNPHQEGTTMEGLGRLFDIGSVIGPVADLAAGANTGHRIHLSNASAVTFVAYLGAVSAGTDTTVLDVQQHTAATAGTSGDLDVVTQWYYKGEATLDGDETWTKVTQAAASEISLTGATFAAQQLIVAVHVAGVQLSDGYEWVSLDIADAGAGGTRAGCVLALLHDLNVQRAPNNLAQLNA
jgi:hypothetical protein